MVLRKDGEVGVDEDDVLEVVDDGLSVEEVVGDGEEVPRRKKLKARGVSVFSRVGKWVDRGRKEGGKKRRRRAHQFKVLDHRSPFEPSLVSFEPPVEMHEKGVRQESSKKENDEERRKELTSRESKESGDLLVNERLTDLDEDDHVRVSHEEKSCSMAAAESSSKKSALELSPKSDGEAKAPSPLDLL